MESLHAAVFDPEGINADGPDASVSSPSKRTSRDTILRMSNLIEPTTTGAQNQDATKAFHDWTIAKDIQSIAEVDSDLFSDWSEYPILLPMDESELYIHSWLKTRESENALRLATLCIGLASSIWIPSIFTAGLRCTHPRFPCEETTLPNSFFNTSWFYLLGHLNHPPASRRLLDRHVRELPCANYPPAASSETGPYSDSNSGLHSQVFGAVALKDWTCRSNAGGCLYTCWKDVQSTRLEVLKFLVDAKKWCIGAVSLNYALTVRLIGVLTVNLPYSEGF
jgi:hypothetical protein